MNQEHTPLSILIAEDEPMVAMLLEDLLGDAGYEVFLAESLNKALAVAHDEHVDLAILDVRLGPDESFPLADILHHRGTPFLFASGHGRDGIPERFSEKMILQKPYDMKSLQHALVNLRNNPAA